jgi:hypothetical protein
VCCEEATVRAHLDTAYRLLGVNRGGPDGRRDPRVAAAVALYLALRHATGGMGCPLPTR